MCCHDGWCHGSVTVRGDKKSQILSLGEGQESAGEQKQGKENWTRSDK